MHLDQRNADRIDTARELDDILEAQRNTFDLPPLTQRQVQQLHFMRQVHARVDFVIEIVRADRPPSFAVRYSLGHRPLPSFSGLRNR